MDRSGQVLLGKYELTRMLGKGGMGEVWEGEHQLTGRRVAVKILSDAYLSNKKVVARFGREARAASAVNHQGIVEILDQDRTAEGVPFLVMEFLEGETVGQRIKRKRKLSENEALAIMLSLLDALHAAHEAGVIHRDLKPDNVFILPGVRGDEAIKILDFGISQKADEIEHRLTQEGSVLGTPHYMSPEQARGEANIDVRVDVYAAAVLFYECVVGEVPFDAGNYNALLQIIIARQPEPPSARGVALSATLEQVLMAALAKRRDERPPNARVFRELLLEAGLQDPAARLERQSWKFQSLPSTPSLAPRPRPASPAAPPSLAPLAPRPAPPAAASSLAPLAPRPAPLPSPPPSSLAPLSSLAPRPAPSPPKDPFELEADLFAPARSTGRFSLPRDSRHMEPSWTSDPRPRGGEGGATPAPLAPPSHESLPALTLDRDAGARGSLVAPPIELAVPLAATRAAQPAAPRPAARARVAAPFRRLPRRRQLGRAVAGWLAVLVAIALLGYVASAVFTRPDARKHRKPAAEPAPAPAPER